ncbi:MAG: Rrf2 family transcriptional regulator [Flavobacteriaceae bacterium]|nr:Rrf2 family transcriptional regulator [Flavobacteriaceae bacterium]
MLSHASKYAIRAVIFLVLHSDKQKKLGVKYIAETLGIPEPFLAKLLQQLVRGNLLSSVKGPNGGFYISDANEKNNMCQIIEEIDGHPLFDTCFMGLDACSATNPCPLHHLVVDFKENLLEKFEVLSLKEFAEDLKLKGQFLN